MYSLADNNLPWQRGGSAGSDSVRTRKRMPAGPALLYPRLGSDELWHAILFSCTVRHPLSCAYFIYLERTVAVSTALSFGIVRAKLPNRTAKLCWYEVLVSTGEFRNEERAARRDHRHKRPTTWQTTLWNGDNSWSQPSPLAQIGTSPLEDGAIPDSDPAGTKDDAEVWTGPLLRYGRPLGDDARSIRRGRTVVDRIWISWKKQPTGENLLVHFYLLSAATVQKMLIVVLQCNMINLTPWPTRVQLRRGLTITYTLSNSGTLYCSGTSILVVQVSSSEAHASTSCSPLSGTWRDCIWMEPQKLSPKPSGRAGKWKWCPMTVRVGMQRMTPRMMKETCMSGKCKGRGSLSWYHNHRVFH